jgi:sensor histidine kinase YesM
MQKILSSRLLQHCFFWGAAFYILFRLFSTSEEVLKIDLIYTSIFIITLLPGIYLNLLALIPYLLGKRKYFLFGALFLVSAFASAGFNEIVFSRFIDYLLPGYYFISYYEYPDLLKFVVAFMGITSLLKLSKGWFMLKETENRLTLLQKENTENRLLALKSQMNPHFLFNSLSGIYNLVLKQSPDTPKVVLRLSDFLRHILYEAEADKVSLVLELAAMQDYIELQRIRSGPSAVITLDMKGDAGKYRIAPLLLLPLLENSFKHGVKGALDNTYAKFEFITEPGYFTARLSNNKGISAETDTKYKGIGLKNLKQRLELLYPGRHQFLITESDAEFKVELKVPLDE